MRQVIQKLHNHYYQDRRLANELEEGCMKELYGDNYQRHGPRFLV